MKRGISSRLKRGKSPDLYVYAFHSIKHNATETGRNQMIRNRNQCSHVTEGDMWQSCDEYQKEKKIKLSTDWQG